MPFKKGDPRPPGSGRKKGTPHKKSILVKEILDSHGINLIEQIIVRLKDISKVDQVKALMQLLPYVYPKLTSVIHSGGIDLGDITDKSKADQLLLAAKTAAEIK
jgi:hypothetical protein